MASSFPVPTLEEIHGLIVADHRNRIPDDDVSRYSDNWKRDRVLAGAAFHLHAHISTVYEDLLADGAAGAQLDRIGAIHDVVRKPATASSGTDALRVYGVAGSILTTGDALTHTDGTEYEVNEDTAIPGAGFVDVNVVSTSTGSSTRKKAGEVLRFSSPPAGVEAEAELQADLEGGDDEEGDGAYRARILDKIAFPGMGGNANDYRTWAVDAAGVGASAYVYPNRNGVGSVDLAFLKSGQGTARIPSGAEIAAVDAAVNAARPVSVKDYRTLTPVAQVQDVDIEIEAYDDPAYAFDWGPASVTVTSWDAATRVLGLSARPGDMRAGHRLIVKNTATRNNGAELKIEALGPGANEVTISPKTPPDVAPEVGTDVYSGGPLVEPIRQAVLAYMNALGTAHGAFAAAGLIYDSALKTSKLYKIATAQEGVDDATVRTPTGNVAATDPGTDQISVIIPRQVIVRGS